MGRGHVPVGNRPETARYDRCPVRSTENLHGRRSDKGAAPMSETLENLLQERRRFAPPSELAANANVTADAYGEAAADRLEFWAKQAGRLSWARPWDQVLDWTNPPFAKW